LIKIISSYCLHQTALEIKEKVFEFSSLVTAIGTWFIVESQWVNILISFATFIVYFVVAMLRRKKIRAESRKLAQETIRLEKENTNLDLKNRIDEQELRHKMLINIQKEVQMEVELRRAGLIDDEDQQNIGKEMIIKGIESYNEKTSRNTR
jgi:hypothetical protein